MLRGALLDLTASFLSHPLRLLSHRRCTIHSIFWEKQHKPPSSVFYLPHIGRYPTRFSSRGTRWQLLGPWAALPGTQTQENEEEDSDLATSHRLALTGTDPPFSLTSQLSQTEGPPTLAGLLQYFLFLLFMSDASRQTPLKSLTKPFSSHSTTDTEPTIDIPRTDKTLS